MSELGVPMEVPADESSIAQSSEESHVDFLTEIKKGNRNKVRLNINKYLVTVACRYFKHFVAFYRPHGR